MANAEPINIQIDPDHLRTQISAIIDEEVLKFADKLRFAADALDPGWIKHHQEWTEQTIEDRVAQRLKEAEK